MPKTATALTWGSGVFAAMVLIVAEASAQSPATAPLTSAIQASGQASGQAAGPSTLTPGATAPVAATPAPATTLSPAEIMARAKKAREITHTYAEKLKVGIVQALKDGGPKAGIGACHTLAPELNSRTTEETTFEIARTALKVRNPDNTPDVWEQAGLENFQKQITGGADPKKIELFEVTQTKEGQSIFRYMRPIMMGDVCMACHGPAVALDVKGEISQYYPDDKAVGYNLNELRGAFTLVQQLD